MSGQRWTPARAAAATRRHIAAARKTAQIRLAQAAEEWGDEDEFLRIGAEHAMVIIEDTLDSYLKELNESMQDRAAGENAP